MEEGFSFGSFYLHNSGFIFEGHVNQRNAERPAYVHIRYGSELELHMGKEQRQLS